LIIDDNATNQRILEEMLEVWGMVPESSASGEEGLELLTAAKKKGTPFPLVLLDAQMPGMDGFTVAETIKKTPTSWTPSLSW